MRIKSLFACIGLAAAMLATSCVKDDAGKTDKSVNLATVPVKVNWSVAGMTPGDEATRAAMAAAGNVGALAAKGVTRVVPGPMDTGGAYDDATPVVENMWIIQFDGVSSSSKLLGAPRFVANEDLPVLGSPDPYPLTTSVPLVQTAGPAYTLFVANIGQGNLFNWNLSSESTFADAVTRIKTLATESDSYETFSVSGNMTLLMSAVTTDQVILGTPLMPVFDRSVAKVTLNLTIDPSATDMSIVSVRLRNVSNQIAYAESALALTGLTPTTIWPVDVAPVDYNAVTTGLPAAAGGSATLSWYVPRNQQGVAALSGAAQTKTAYAPVNATYFEIIAVKGGATPSTSVFRVYPGADMTADFNLTPNKHYTVGLNVVGIGTDPSDSRVQTFGTVDYTWATTSNSFIINPPPVGGMAAKYRIPISQVNNYWGGAAAGYGDMPSKMIGAADPWTVSLIWCDLAGLFSTTTSTTAITLSKATGSGAADYFELNVPTGLPAGNFLIGIKKTGDPDFLWSWHFWVTDYAPDKFNKSAIAAGTYTYPVPGGQVERYGAPASGTDLWSPGPAGIYAGSVSMDRNLGAVENFFTTPLVATSRGLLYYQFGRKDPFPSVLAAGLGTNPAITFPTGPTTIATSVANPWAYYAIAGNWTNDANGTTYLWQDPNTSMTGKSVYDPCPPGWKQPVSGTWNDFNRQDGGQFVTVMNPLRDLAWSFGRGIGSPLNNVNGMRYWPGTTLTDPVAGRIWFPPLGYRNGSTGAIVNLGLGYYSSASSAAATTCSCMTFSAAAMTPTVNTFNRATGLPIRCISE